MKLSVPTLALASYRLARLITTDTITKPIRTKIMTRWNPQDHEGRNQINFGYLVSCPHCSSIYGGAILSGLALLATSERISAPVGTAARLLISTLALSGAVSLYHDTAEHYADAHPQHGPSF